MKADTLKSILDNYDSLLILWEEMLTENMDSEVRAKVAGVKAQMETFGFLYGKLEDLCVDWAESVNL